MGIKRRYQKCEKSKCIYIHTKKCTGTRSRTHIISSYWMAYWHLCLCVRKRSRILFLVEKNNKKAISFAFMCYRSRKRYYNIITILTATLYIRTRVHICLMLAGKRRAREKKRINLCESQPNRIFKINFA